VQALSHGVTLEVESAEARLQPFLLIGQIISRAEFGNPIPSLRYTRAEATVSPSKSLRHFLQELRELPVLLLN
jgi:hypothetical protein